jgi:serine O-acetyltransferase
VFLLLIVIRLTNGLWPLRRLALSGPPLVRHVARVLYDVYLDARGSYIPLDAVFVSEPVFPHGPSGVMVSGGARVGVDCVLFHQVTIGSNTLAGSRGFGFPTIGDGCYLGAGAKVIGGVTLGDNVRVGANAVVTRDVPSNTVVVGLNEQHPRSELDNRYFANRDGWQFWSGGAWHRGQSPAAQANEGSAAAG